MLENGYCEVTDMAEVILGLDLLQTNHVVVDLEQQRLSFWGCGEAILLGAKAPKATGIVCAIETISIPHCSELEVMGQVRTCQMDQYGY